MNFNELSAAMQERCKLNFICRTAVDDFKRQIDRVYAAGWELLELGCSGEEAAQTIPSIYSSFRYALQLKGMAMTIGQSSYDKAIWEGMTEILEAMRQVLAENYPKVNLPKARVVSMIDDAVEAGIVESCVNETGEKCIRAKTGKYDLKIRIRKTPEGAAPIEVREKWVGLVLPARRCSKAQGKLKPKSYEECYGVSIAGALPILREASEDAVDWFASNFGTLGEFLFHIDEVELITN